MARPALEVTDDLAGWGVLIHTPAGHPQGLLMPDHRPDNTQPGHYPMRETHPICADKVIVTAEDGAFRMVNPRKPGEPPPSRPGRLTVEGAATVSLADDGVMVRFVDPQKDDA